MFFDILPVFVITLISSLFLSTTSVHGLPTSASRLHLITNSPSADLFSSLRLLNHRPVSSVDHDSGGDIFEMLMGDSNENDDSFLPSVDVLNEPSEYYLQSPTSKLLLLEKQHQQKRSTPFNLNSAVATLADSSNADNIVNLNQLNEPLRLSPSLKKLVETNPFARAWLTMLLQKLMKEQSVPYIFKYGRRRK
ncbi:unnamed protein product [Adineta steineri]|uniref:Uncharacterized protein n=1 Tax=Adineta steineri TaxID=433720 RepID=A0A814BCJ5_9BILA|nr:unnamed protein product [Adineta steineri]CAF0942479.1 unnamed protein product [Adineta steineri]CAF0958817.1 unnamed protein product [Adineta steineri]CAF3634175.1 unnamed protein product [Adineta steineri]CAF3653838.1 unnamed protein product [Adineta steineri]